MRFALPKKSKKPEKELKPKTHNKFKTILRRILIVLGTLILFALTVGILFAYDRWQIQVHKAQYTTDEESTTTACTNIVNPECWTEAFKPALLQENNKTSILIIGSDARNNNSFIGNTDTIILAVYDYKTNQTKTISIPRDIFAPYQYKENGTTYYTKINAIYASGSLYGENKDGAKILRRTVEKITGEKIQYMVVVRFDGVIKGIDALGGIEINVPQDHTDVYPKSELPDAMQKTCQKPKLKNGSHMLDGFCVFSFKKGMQHMDGLTALIYARMRELSTDFDRARRQQEVINAVKDKILNDQASLADKAENLLMLYDGIKDYIDLKFDLNLETILAGLDLAQKFKSQGDSAKIVLDPNFAGGGVIIKGDASNFNFKDYTFKQVHAKLQLIDTYLEYYKDNSKLYINNATGANLAKEHPLMQAKNAGLWFMRINLVTGKNPDNKTGVEIIDYSGGLKNATISRLKKDLGGGDDIIVITATPENGLKPIKGEDVGVNIYPAKPVATLVPTTAPTK
jgi:LCP family protein required for cell wall assembly